MTWAIRLGLGFHSATRPTSNLSVLHQYSQLSAAASVIENQTYWEMQKPLYSVNNFLFLVDFSFAAGSNEQLYSGRPVFGFVEKADVKRVQSTRNGGDDSTSRFPQ